MIPWKMPICRELRAEQARGGPPHGKKDAWLLAPCGATYIGTVSSPAKSVRSAFQKYLMIPKLVLLSRSAPKDRPLAWNRYWAGIRATGAGGEVLWDSGKDDEFLGYKDVLRRHLDPELPVVDVGCGHGSFTRALAEIFPHVIGVDVAASAVAHARAESEAQKSQAQGSGPKEGAAKGEGAGQVRYEVRDMTSPDAASGLASPRGANVFIRGVLHVLSPADQVALVANLRLLAGERGTIFLAETNFQGNPVDYISHLGATARDIPAPLERAIRGLPMPGRFGPAERSEILPDESWELVEDGAVAIETNPMTDVAAQSRIPGYYAVVRPRP
jgi:SAM-dependent methyltransferase